MPSRKATKEQLLEDVYELKLNIPQIAEKYGYNVRSVWRALKYRGIPYPNYFTGTSQLTSQQREFIVGTLLGDAHMPKQGRFIRFVHGMKQEDYLLWKADLLSGWIAPRGIEYSTHVVSGKTYPQVGFCTVTHNDFGFYESLFYTPLPEHKKVITLDVLNLVTPFALAVWFMDDGSCLPKKGIRLHTAGFSWDENYLIQKWFMDSMNLKCTVAKISRGYPVLTFYSNSAKDFREIVKPYLLPSFAYKIDF